MIDPREVERLIRELAPRVLSVLMRRYGGFDAAEDAVQEALLAAATTWPEQGLPANPAGWLVTTASRRLIETMRSDTARRRREQSYATAESFGHEPATEVDDTLALLFLCCHPALTAPAQIALTLRALGGLTTAEIARAMLVPEATVAQRISRAKGRIKTAGAHFARPTGADVVERLPSVMHVLYLIFNEGHTASAGGELQRVELSAEAIRLTRQLHERVADGEVAGLLALMLLTDARRAARTTSDGAIVPLAEQDRTRWDRTAIAEGTALVAATLPVAEPGPFQIQAAIAAVHDEAPSVQETDWDQILALYGVLAMLAPGPMVTLNRVVALAMAQGPAAALAELDGVTGELGDHYRVDAVRAHLLDELGEHEEARAHYVRAAQRSRSLPEQRYLRDRARGQA